MQTVTDPKKISRLLKTHRESGRRIGFAPTMGFLHRGHLSLIEKARRETDIIVASIFVNPTQFGPKEDFKKYPRDLKRDQQLLARAKTDYLFVPSEKAIYPSGFRGWVEPGPLNRYLCGPKRPGHFRGVATVVKRLFEIIQPDQAYFGQKDYQQVKVIEQMVKSFHLPILIRMCPIVRENDGLAMSSRNVYLSRSERKRARALYQSLRLGKSLIHQGVLNPGEIKSKMTELLSESVDRIDYAEAADPQTLKPVRNCGQVTLLAAACFLARTRLIDNLLVKR